MALNSINSVSVQGDRCMPIDRGGPIKCNLVGAVRVVFNFVQRIIGILRIESAIMGQRVTVRG